MSVPEEDAAFRELPYYKSILKCFLRKQIGSLIQELATETGDESVILMANTSTGTTSCLSSSNAKHFMEAHTDIQTRFLSYCLSGYPDVSSCGIKTLKSGKRKPKNEPKNTQTPKHVKHSTLSSPPASTVDETVSESANSAGKENEPSLSTGVMSESLPSQPPSIVLAVYPENEENGENTTTSSHTSSCNRENVDGVNTTGSIKVEPLTDEAIMDFTCIKTEPESQTEIEKSQLNESTDMSYLSDVPCDQSLDNSVTTSPGGTQTFGPIRFVRKFPPKERTTLSLPEKIQIIQDYESGGTTSQRKLADKYNISKSAVADMLKNRELLKEHYEFNANTKRKRFNTNSKFADINEVVWQWFRTARENGIQMSGPMIQEKALQVAQDLKVKEFKGSNGWLHSWKSRYNITSYRDDMNTSQKQNYINDYSKVQGFNAAGPNSEATNAIMNLGSLVNIFSTSSANQLSTTGTLNTSYPVSCLQQGSNDLTNSGNTCTDSQLSQNITLESENIVKHVKIGPSLTAWPLPENTTNNTQCEAETSPNSIETISRTAAYEKIVASAVSEFEKQNTVT